VHLVRDSARAPAIGSSAPLRRSALAGIVALAIAASGAACSDSQPTGASGEGKPSLGPINLADCSDWRQGSEQARRRAIEEIRRFAGGPVPASGGGSGAVLTGDQAYRLFDSTCERDYARGFRLYKLYSRGAVFGGR
jgi:hypothetical protein